MDIVGGATLITPDVKTGSLEYFWPYGTCTDYCAVIGYLAIGELNGRGLANVLPLSI